MRDLARLPGYHTITLLRRQPDEPVVNDGELIITNVSLRVRGHLARSFADDLHELGIRTLQSRERRRVATFRVRSVTRLAPCPGKRLPALVLLLLNGTRSPWNQNTAENAQT